ncbi:hypothetical protein [Klebsiella pneumoniae]|uniref:hypothetical protein n=1 Tax=Klebsiella pneumoniae TaxID=573 RepID=UPI00211EF6F0|nr:hypothetical protein [Klebsiella pneumoniae]
MTKSTITRERIQRIIRAIDSEAYDEEEIREWLSSDEIMELSRMALAAMDSEPVASVNCVTAEHRRVIEMLLTVCGAAFELADDSCLQDFDGEECHVVPDDAFQKLSDALDEIENTLPTEDADRPDVFLVWSAVPRAALKSILHAQPAPVVSADLLHTAASAIEDLLTTKGRMGAYVWFDLPFRLRSAANAQPAPVVPAVSDDIGEIRVGRLPTMNQDDYPGLGDWWVQLRIGEDSDEVLARVYGATPQEANNRAEALACRAAMLSGGKS